MVSHTRAWIAGAAALLLLLPGLGATDLWAPDEPRYAQVAEELRRLDHGPAGLALLRLNGEVYTQKPPLYFWLAALLGAPTGRVTEWAARLPSALAGVASVALVAALGARLLGARAGLLGGALLLTAWEFAWRARRAQLDVLLTLCEVTALAAFWHLAGEDDGAPRARRRRSLALLHAALGLAVLTKGPVGFLVPALVMAAFLAWEGRLRELPGLAPPWALALSLGPGLAWLGAAAALAPPGYLDVAVGENLVGRFFAGTSHPRPLYYYLYQLPLAFLPWTLLWPLAFRESRRVFAPGADARRARAWRFLVAWVAASFVFFSLSAGKRGLYLLPAFPALALLCADALGVWLAARTPRPGRAAAALVGGVGALLLALFTLGQPLLEDEKSPRPVAEAAAALTRPGEPIGLLAKRTLVGGLVYYGDRPVAVLTSPEETAGFLAAGGGAVVIRARDLSRVEELTPVAVRARARTGSRELLVIAGDPR